MMYDSLLAAKRDGWRIAVYDIDSDRVVMRLDDGNLLEVDPKEAHQLQIGGLTVSAVRLGRPDA